ncbi:MAG: peroxide stress protein YaaA [Actinobacteria bacterium HGW-Actinobacteria-2]|nr:MAG: peroxide stress protein YaaA [Actinobacteria bacterium HGW-Actinobacteria-2]
MLILLSPAKALDFDSAVPSMPSTLPRLLDQSVALAAVMQTKSVAEVAALQHLSDELAALNVQRWADFAVPFPDGAARPAIFAFNGDAYQGLAARERFTDQDYQRAQTSLRILSGLYGVLRPLDLILAYRLEMGTRLTTDRGASLYQWWGERITDQLRADLAESGGERAVVNLASTEYFSAVQPQRLDAPVITPRFEDTNARGRRSVISFYAKRARGEMAAWLITNAISATSELLAFDRAGYRYDQASSSPTAPVFVRPFADRVASSGLRPDQPAAGSS